jgi:hypothetical protein
MEYPAGDAAATVEAWRAQLGRVGHELAMAHLHQIIWTEMRDEIQARRPNADGMFLASYSQCYVRSQMMVVRALVDTKRRPESLANLIKRIQNRRDVTTRSWYENDRAATAVDSWVLADAIAYWDRVYADPADPELLNPLRLRDDLGRLHRELHLLTTWANKTIAHLDPDTPTRVPTLHELRDGLAALTEVFGTYERLLTGAVTAWDLLTIDGDWHGPFRPSLFPLDFNVYAWPDPAGYD